MRPFVLTAAALLFATACTKKTEAPAAPPVDEGAAPEVVVVEQPAEEEAAGEYVVQGTVERWHIADALEDCVGVAPMKCMRIRRADNPEWELFYDNIDGFEWQEGTRYILEVDVIDVENPPADASSKRYVLVKQVVPALDEDGKARECKTSADCGDEEICAGPAGCDVPWTCQGMRPCTMDLRAYCSCDGETIQGSGSCPPAPYKHPGPCAGDN